MRIKQPKNWQKVKLGNVASFYYGKMPERGRLNTGGIYPVYTGYQNVGYYNEYNSDEDLIVVARGVGGTGDIKISPPKSFVTNLSIVIKLNPKLVYRDYLFYKFNKGLRYLDSGSAQSQITITDLEKIEIELPHFITQKRIADILSNFDDKIELNNKINKNLEETAQAIFKEWFIKNPEAKNWETKKIKQATACLTRGISPEYIQGGVPVINQRCVRDGLITFEEIQYAKPPIDKNDKRVLKNGDILINSMGTGTLGRISRAFKIDYLAWIHSCITVIRANNKICLQNYLYWALKTREKEIELLGDGSTGQTSLKENVLEDMELLVPPIDMQERFSKIQDSFNNQIDLNIKENQKLGSLRDLLLPKLMSGEIRV